MIIPETISSKVWHASGLKNMDKILSQHFALRADYSTALQYIKLPDVVM